MSISKEKKNPINKNTSFPLTVGLIGWWCYQQGMVNEPFNELGHKKNFMIGYDILN